MIVAVGIFNFLDPVYLLWGRDGELRPMDTELAQVGLSNERWGDPATVTDRE